MIKNMNRFCRLVLIVGLFALNSTVSAQERLDSKGNDFWIAFPSNYSGSAIPSLFISSETATSGTVSIPGEGYSLNFTTTPGTVTTVTLSTLYELRVLNGIENKGIHITSQKEVTVYGLSRLTHTTDAFLCLPTDVLGDSYIIPSYIGLGGTGGASQLVVIGTKDGTTVTIIPTVTAQTRTAGVPFTITLNQGEAFQLQATGTGDLTGSLVTSSTPVAVFGSVQCANITTSCTACDFIVEEIPPISTWGKSFIAAPLASRSGDIYRFLASEDATTINVNGTTVATLNKGQFVEKLYSTGLHITSDKAISVIQYSRGSSCDGALGDPFMMLIPPYEQFLGNYTISTSDNGFPSNYINLVVPTRAIGDVRVDGSIVPASSFTAIGLSGFHYTAISITIGTHTINSNDPIGVHVYGFGSYDSYGYPGGQSFSQIAYVDSITLTPPTSTAQTGTSSCVQATVLDNNANRVIGVRVDFYVSGVNTSSGFAFTDLNGVAEYCYTGLAAGTDLIYAVTGSLTSNTVHKTWTSTATFPVADAGPDQLLYVQNGCTSTATLNGSGSNGESLLYAWTGPFTGTLTGATPSTILSIGANSIILRVTDSHGSHDIDTVIITVKDTIAPVPDQSPLPIITSQCQTTVSAPTATDNCSGVITATTTDPLTYNIQDTFKITWTYDDGNGNTSTQLQTVIIDDTIAPVPQTDSLPVLRGECSFEVTTSPTAFDSCTGKIITATTTDSKTYNSQGTFVIDWIYNDGNGNTSTQLQTVIIADTTDPVPEIKVLPTLTGECSLTATPPFATDNCAGRISATTSGLLTFSTQGTHNILWTYDDGNGNTSTQTQKVIIKDTIAPSITVLHDTTVVISVLKLSSIIAIDSAKAHDSCSSVQISAIRSDGLPLDSAFSIGKTLITWKACDINGNCASSVQTVTVRSNKTPVLTTLPDTTMNEGEQITLAISAKDLDNTVPTITLINPPSFLTLTHIRKDSALIVSRPGCIDHGLYTIRVQASDGIDSVVTDFKIQVDDVDFAPVFDLIENQQIKEEQPFNFNVHVTDCDGTIPQIKIISTPTGASFVDNKNGNGTLTWIPNGDDNGYYVVIFEAGDGFNTVRDTSVIEVVDANCFPPVLNLSSTAITSSINLPITIRATTSDLDGLTPYLITSTLPSGARFTTIDDSTGIFNWTPMDTGNYTVTITVIDAFDTTMKVSKTITLVINNDNLTGPVFIHVNDTSIVQNKEMVLQIKAVDPDGSIPTLQLISGPQGARVTDNKNGTGTVVWTPDCSISGLNKITLGASDPTLSDTLVINVNVRDINCAPIINHIADISANPREVVRIPVSASDPDNDGSTLVLSAASDISGFTFTTSGSGMGEFRCNAPNDSGLFPVIFYVTDGFLTDSIKVTISVAKLGSIKIFGNQTGIQIFAMPSGCFRGSYLGQDSITYTAPQGTYWFEVQAPGYRARRVSCNVKADTTLSQLVTLKPSIPLMISSPDTLTVGTAASIPESGTFSFVDLNGDRVEDLVTLSINKSTINYGIDSVNNLSYHNQVTGNTFFATGFNPLHHTFADWDNDGIYDCILSDKSGNVVVIESNGIKETLIKRTGEKLYPFVLDFDKDGKKDLVLHSEGVGIFRYRNSGSDAVPVILFPDESTNGSGQSLISLKGAPVLIDMDKDNKEEMVIFSEGVLKVFSIDSTFSQLVYKEDLNCGGKRITADSASIALIGSPNETPKIAIRTNEKILIYRTHLLGDVNSDSVVNIQDISRISKQLEYKESDSGYTPVHNLKLSDNDDEIIDIKDISKASKCWEMQE